MSRFYVRDQQFWLDDRPVLIQAGEFHYFRTPREEWPQRLNRLQQAGFNAVATYIPWLWHQTAEGESDLDGHSHPLRDLAGYLDLVAEMGFLIIPRPGPYIMAETINEGIPPWVFEHYPQVAAISQKEQTQNIVSYLHPDFLACVDGWYEAVFAVLAPREVTRGGRIIMVQLDNEMGMQHWLRGLIDINADTLDRFAAWLAQRYGGALGQRYPAEELPAFLRQEIVQPSAAHGSHIVADYHRFYRDYLGEYMALLWEMARTHGMETPPVVNVHGFSNHRGGRTFAIGLSQLIKAIELPDMITATDVYPIHIDEGNADQLLMANEATAALQNPEQPLFSIEFQSGGNQDFGGHQTSLYDLHTRLVVSQGMRAVNHYSFFAGENDPGLSPVRRHDWGPPVRNDGSVRRHFARYRRLSDVLDAYGEALVRARPHTVATVGFLLDYFMTEYSNEFTKEATRIIADQREWVLHDFLARGLNLTHRPFDALELSRADLDPAQTPVLFAMLEKQCPADVQQKLVDYARAGGHLLLAGRLPEWDFEGRPATALRNALGVTAIHSDPPFIDTEISAFDYPYVPVRFVESYSGDFDESFAHRQDGETVGFIQSVGQGRVMIFGATVPARTPDDIDLFDRMALKIGCPRLFELGDWADVRASRGEQGSFLYVSNYQDDPVVATVAYDGARLFGGHALHLPARRGLILPLDWQAAEGVLVHYATGEVAGLSDEPDRLVLRLVPSHFVAELTLSGYRCEGAIPAGGDEEQGRVRVARDDGQIVLYKEV